VAADASRERTGALRFFFARLAVFFFADLFADVVAVERDAAARAAVFLRAVLDGAAVFLDFPLTVLPALRATGRFFTALFFLATVSSNLF
jgi:hypothetical protein